MGHAINATKETWYIAHTDEETPVHGKLEPGSSLGTPLKTLETYSTEAEYLTRCEELGIETDSDT